MRKIAIAIVAVAIGMQVLGVAQEATVNVPAATQWEYLVVSPGKFCFVSPVAEPEWKTTGLSKAIGYAPLGLTMMEAVDVQSQMDALGRLGWEAVVLSQVQGFNK